jgi:hypothetical protein
LFLGYITVFSTVNSLNGGLIRNGEIERIWKDAVMAYYNILFQKLPGGLWKSTVNLKMIER